MHALIVHPTAAYLYRGKPRPVTIKVIPAKKPKGPTRNELKAMCERRGFKVMSRHTKAELEAMMTSGQQSRPAAQDRCNEKRRKPR